VFNFPSALSGRVRSALPFYLICGKFSHSHIAVLLVNIELDRFVNYHLHHHLNLYLFDLSSGRKCQSLNAKDMDEIEKIAEH
jgi:hypothetical protein